jgi:hypothetical protein
MQVSEKFTIFDRFDILFHTVSSKCGVLFPYIKRTICIFLAFAIFFNVFVTKNCEFNNKFLIALNCAVNTIESTVFNEYTNALMRTITGAVQDLSVIIQKTLEDQNNNRNNTPIPVTQNSSSDDMILLKRVTDTCDTVTFIKSNLYYSISDIINNGNTLYKNAIINCKRILNSIGILLFILFSVYVVKRKDVVNYNILKNCIDDSNRLA